MLDKGAFQLAGKVTVLTFLPVLLQCACLAIEVILALLVGDHVEVDRRLAERVVLVVVLGLARRESELFVPVVLVDHAFVGLILTEIRATSTLTILDMLSLMSMLRFNSSSGL